MVLQPDFAKVTAEKMTKLQFEKSWVTIKLDFDGELGTSWITSLCQFLKVSANIISNFSTKTNIETIVFALVITRNNEPNHQGNID